jgi:FKBP-type peptidyl-prolyl cis-trans isomerase (trigger factor)
MVNYSEDSRTKHEERLRLSFEKDVNKKKYVKTAVKHISKKEKRNLPRTLARQKNETMWKQFLTNIETWGFQYDPKHHLQWKSPAFMNKKKKSVNVNITNVLLFIPNLRLNILMVLTMRQNLLGCDTV